jgi:hypothetical protein
MPVIDDDATLQLIFDAIKYENDSMSLEKMAHHISLGEGLWEDDGEANGIQKRTMDAVIDLGGEIKNNLLRIKAYVDGELPYEYRRMLDDSSVILTKRQKYWCQTTHSF